MCALDQRWSPEAITLRIENANPKPASAPVENPLPDEVLDSLSQIGWAGSLDELTHFFRADARRFRRWLAFIQQETPADTYQAGRLLEGLRSGLSAPLTQSEKYAQVQQTFSMSNAAAPEPMPAVDEDIRLSWDWSLNSFGIAKGQIASQVVAVDQAPNQLNLTIRAEDLKSYHHLQNIVGYDYFSTLLRMVYRQPVRIKVEEFGHG